MKVEIKKKEESRVAIGKYEVVQARKRIRGLGKRMMGRKTANREG